MPAAFLGHGSPMNALEQNRYTAAWQTVGASVPRPRAILVISAHWYINATAVTAMDRPRTIHDFYGFPQELFDVEYPAPGDPDLAEEVADVVEPVWVGVDRDSWGLDHGTWSVLRHVFPGADVPVVQLSINANKPLDYHVDLGARLAPLRDRGVLIVGSGNVVHNLGRVQPRLADGAFDWAKRFDEQVRGVMTDDPSAVGAVRDHGDFRAAVPTPDHFIPLLYLAGLAGAAGRPTDVLVDGYAYGSVSMTAYTLGARATAVDRAGGAGSAGAAGAAPLPDADEVPPEDSNM
jgi:4,5-DOPA dioxygenase extradiol